MSELSANTVPLTAASNALVAFWFGDPIERLPSKPRHGLWFNSTDRDDADMRARYATLVEQALTGELEHWLVDAVGHLAVVLLLDQMTRNIFRGTARAFAGDEPALAAANAAIVDGLEHSLAPVQRVFLYMPFEHHETLAAQDRCVSLFDSLAAELDRAADIEQRDMVLDFASHANEHRDIIERFGRFPHRNSVLGRESTPQELEYFADGGKSFGQHSVDS